MKKLIIKNKLIKRGYKIVELPNGKIIVKNNENIGKLFNNYNQAKKRYLYD
jgi:hypothetical protein